MSIWLTARSISIQVCAGEDSACGNKFRYETAVQATKAAYHREEVKPGERFDVYQCYWCGFYHYGHSWGSPGRRG